MVADELPGTVRPSVPIAVIEEGSRAPGGSAETLEGAVRDQVLRAVWRERREVLEHLSQNLGRQEYAVQGAAEVAQALRMSQVDTVVLSDDPSSTLQAWIGKAPTEFGMTGSEDQALEGDVRHDRYDAALVRAAAATGAKLVITPGAHEYVRDGVGALLRYETAG
jgi:stalled ribosome rescue protein Dom34